MGMPNKKRENCLDLIAKQFGGNVNIGVGVASKNFIRMLKDIAYGNITKEDFEKYGEFFINQQNINEFAKTAENIKSDIDLDVMQAITAIECGKRGLVPQILNGYPQQQPIQGNPVQMGIIGMGGNPFGYEMSNPTYQPNQFHQQNMWGSIMGQQQPVANVPDPRCTPNPQQQYYQQNNIPMVIGNPFDLSTNGKFAQNYDLKCRKQRLWTHINEFFQNFNSNYEMFVQDYIRHYLGFQTSLNNMFRRDFALIDK